MSLEALVCNYRDTSRFCGTEPHFYDDRMRETADNAAESAASIRGLGER